MGLFDSVKNAFAGTETENSSDMWERITDSSQIAPIIEASREKPQLIYKHSHRCSVCFVARGTLERASAEILQHADMHFVNVVNSREASNAIALELEVRHESPQAILVKNGEVIWHASHGSIDADAILKALQ